MLHKNIVQIRSRTPAYNTPQMVAIQEIQQNPLRRICQRLRQLRLHNAQRRRLTIQQQNERRVPLRRRSWNRLRNILRQSTFRICHKQHTRNNVLRCRLQILILNTSAPTIISYRKLPITHASFRVKLHPESSTAFISTT